jgi:Tol biopolymer transport system component/DNA-binding winged helix-turn-helix (wHTH) protein
MADATQPFRIHDWVVHPRLNRVSDGGQTVQLEPRVMQVLVCLAERRGDVVSRAELLDAVWADVVVGEESLTGAVSALRRFLGDDAQSPRYIETIRKGGYRLVAPVLPVVEGTAAADLAIHSGAVPARRTVVARIAIAIGVLVVAAAVAWLLRDARGSREMQPVSDLSSLQAVPFTSYPGTERMPAVSPDGTRIAFSWSGSEDEDTDATIEIDIYVKQANTEVPLRLTEQPGVELNPAWSPDGTEISYFHADDDGAGIYVIPSIGGEPRRLITAPGLKGPHSWSPDGTSIAYAEAQGLFVRELTTGQRRRLTVPPVSCCGDKAPVFSPDGRAVAFIRIDAAYREDLYVMGIKGGEPRRLTRGLLRLQGFDWARDGQSLVCSSGRSGRYSLWRVDGEDGSLAPVPTRGDWAVFPSIARRSDRMVYMDLDLNANIWRMRRLDPPGSGVSSEPLITSTRVDLEAAYSPDSQLIAFTSNRSGSMELWVCRADGSGPLQLTSFGGIFVGGPCWSPDGARIAVTAVPGASSVVYMVAADGGGRPLPLTGGDHNDSPVAWSRDGGWLYIASDRSGGWQLYRMRPEDPKGSVEQVTSDGGIAGIESPDGRFLYVARPERAGLWRLPLDVDPPVPEPLKVVEDLPVPGLQSQWDLCNDGIVVTTYVAGGSRFDIYRFASESVENLVASAPEVSSLSLSVSPDCRSILFAHTESGSADLMLVEGFR